MNHRTPFIALVSLVAVACSAQSSGDSDPTASEGALTHGGSGAAASEKFEKLLFDDEQTAGQVRNYTLMGNVPGSRETCKVEVHRASLHPDHYNWSTLSITPLGRSAARVLEHGPVEVGWAYNGASSAKLKLDTNGSTSVWTETNTGEDSGQPNAVWVLKATLKFKNGDRGIDKLTSVKIDGNDSVGNHDVGACENLKSTFEMKRTDVKTVEKARDKWGTDNNEDVSELAYEGCQMSSPKRLGCNFGNDTNEEQLFMLFEVTDGQIGRMVHADRTSDFH